MDTLFLFLSLYPRSKIRGKIMNKYEKKGNKSKVEISEGKARIGTFPYYYYFFQGRPSYAHTFVFALGKSYTFGIVL